MLHRRKMHFAIMMHAPRGTSCNKFDGACHHSSGSLVTKCYRQSSIHHARRNVMSFYRNMSSHTNRDVQLKALFRISSEFRDETKKDIILRIRRMRKSVAKINRREESIIIFRESY